jgi:hypothetical protein
MADKEIHYIIGVFPDDSTLYLTNMTETFPLLMLHILGPGIDVYLNPRDIVTDPYSDDPDARIYAAQIVTRWALNPKRTEDEKAAADSYLKQWPEGPQLHERSQGTAPRLWMN